MGEVVYLTNKLTQKEQSLLRDQLSHEKLCIQKYNNYAEQAEDPQLKQLFSQYSSQEQEHYDTINQLLQGGQMIVSPGQGQAQMRRDGQGVGQYSMEVGAMGQQANQPVKQGKTGLRNQDDAMLCMDMLATEKYISSAYDTAVFESANPEVRQALQHIQTEEQQHGEGLFNYLSQRGMYNPE